MKCIIVIPARIDSTRLPRKLLLSDTGKPLIEHTYRAALTAMLPTKVCVATCDDELAQVVRSFGGEAEETSAGAATGTDRIAEVAQRLKEMSLVVNVQGDEPEIDGEQIDTAIRLLDSNPAADMATLATPIHDADAWRDPACVKVVFDDSARALYFSRSPIPYNGPPSDDQGPPPGAFRHIGVYVYRRDFLLKYASAPRSHKETTEHLEQIRALDLGATILTAVVDKRSRAINTAEDYQRFVSRALRS